MRRVYCALMVHTIHLIREYCVLNSSRTSGRTQNIGYYLNCFRKKLTFLSHMAYLVSEKYQITMLLFYHKCMNHEASNNSL